MSRALLFSLLLPLLVLADQSQPSQLPPAQYNGGDDNPPDPSDAGAEGSQKGAFNLSKGALAAIIVVAVIVVIGGSMLQLCDFNMWITTNVAQLVPQLCGGLLRSDNGMSDNQFAALRVASLAVPTQTTSKTARIEEPVFVSTLLLPERTTSQGSRMTWRRVCRCRTRPHRRQRPSQV
jgi:hypothetical protein